MVKQPDGTYMAPQAVIDQMAGDLIYPSQINTAAKNDYDPLDVALFQGNHYREIWGPYMTAAQMERVVADPPPLFSVMTTRTASLRDARAFDQDGLSAYASLELSVGFGSTYTQTVKSLTPPVTMTLQYARVRSKPIIEIWKVVFDIKTGRWIFDQFVDRIVSQ